MIKLMAVVNATRIIDDINPRMGRNASTPTTVNSYWSIIVESELDYG